MRIKHYHLILLSLFINFNASSQVVWENPKYEIYQFLSRQAQKGNIGLDDFIQPISRKEIAQHLNYLKDSVLTHSKTELSELNFYLQEYNELALRDTNSITFLKKDQSGRLRFLDFSGNGFILRGEPVLTLETLQGEDLSVLKRGNGLQFWGQTGKFAFQAYFQDYTETGTGVDRLKDFTPEQGVVRTQTVNPEQLTYSDIKGHVSYNWKYGTVSVGKDNLLVGYGRNGRMILSEKAPSYPFFRLDFHPLKWLKFNYSHAWLQSDIIDSAKSQNVREPVIGDKWEVYVPKFMATHSFTLIPVRGLSLTFGESMIYSNRLDIGYLIPVMFFKAYDHYTSRHNIMAGGNGQFFFQASSRNHIRNTHLYAGLFIDEIRATAIFDRAKSRNQIGFSLGASMTDLLPYFTLGLEYSRINPFVYNNLLESQTYRNQDYLLGDWMGSNADRFLAYADYTPLPRLKTRVQIQHVRKGDPGSVRDQYLAEPQPPFLSGLFREQTESQISASYQWIHNVYINGRLTLLNDHFVSQGNPIKRKIFRFGINIGL